MRDSYLLWSAANEGLGLQQSVQLPQDGGKVGVFLDSGQKVVITTLLFDHSRCLLGQDTDLLMAVLKGRRKMQTSAETDLNTLAAVLRSNA